MSTAASTAASTAPSTMGDVSAAATDWGGSGLAYLTGLPDGPADFSRAPCCPGRTRWRRPSGPGWASTPTRRSC